MKSKNKKTPGEENLMIDLMRTRGITIKLIILALLFQLTLMNKIFAQNQINATITKIRGTVSAVLPNGKKISLKQGDQIPAKTKVRSEDKSFAIITFQDKTKLTLGPKSEMEITAPSTQNDPGLINLLKGQLRSKVQPDKARKGNKLVISTRAAAIGVRGTETVITYNENVNSLTTGGMTGTVIISPPLPNLSIKTANEFLNDSNPKSFKLKATYFSSVTNSNGDLKISAPRKLNPIQLNLLRKNNVPSFQEVNKAVAVNSDHKRSSSLPNMPLSYQVDAINTQVDQQSNAQLGNAQMPAGSFIDLKTGAIIPPTAGSEYDPNSGTFIQNDSNGSVSQDGDYIPPMGLKLDENGNFIASSKETISKADEMNKLVEVALNKEAIFINPNTSDIKNNNVQSELDKNRNIASGKINDNDANIANALIPEISQNTTDTNNFGSDFINQNLSCPGNICDKFDSTPHKSDEASTKTIVQFNIRINNK